MAFNNNANNPILPFRPNLCQPAHQELMSREMDLGLNDVWESLRQLAKMKM